MNKIIIILGISIGYFYAQVPSVEWIKIIGGRGLDKGYSVQQTSDRGYILTGWTTSFGDTVNGDVYLVKTDSLGNLQWQKTFGGSYSDRGQSVKQTNDKGYIVAGWTNTVGWGDTMNDDVYLVKADSLGNLQWQKRFGGHGGDYGNSVQQTNDRGYIIAGTTESFLDLGGDNVYLLKTDSLGNLLWQKTFGGDYDDEGYSVQQTNDKGYIVAGWTESFSGSDDGYLVKTDSLGNLKWQKTCGGTNGDYLSSVRQTLDKGYIATGGTNSYGDTVNGDIYLVKTDSLGNIQWQKGIGGSGDNNGVFIQLTSDRGYIIVGTINTGQTYSFDDGRGNDVYLLKTDSLGNLKWDWTYHQPLMDEGTAVQQVADGGYIVLGNIDDVTSNNFKIYLIKINPKEK